LYAKLKQVQPEFEKMVKQGLFKKRSVSLHPQYGLNHIGFLGALPPAVAGLKDISFMQSGDDCVVIEYAQHEVKTMRIEEQKQIADYKTKLEAYASEIKAKDEKIATLEAELDQKEVEQASFASAQKTELEQAQVRIKTLEDNCKKRDCHEFAGKLVDEGKLTKAEEVGVINFMMKLEEAEMKEYQKQLEARPRLVEFGEKYASPGLAATGVVHYNYGVEVDAERADLDQKVLEYAKSNNVDYEKALNIVIGK
jgi:vacuolar-type H+-ATPase subunit I/STV1